MKKIDKIFIIVIFILSLAYLIKFILTGSGLDCLFYKYTHLYCPGCGVSRMFISVFQLDFYQAYRYNPLVFILGVLTLVYIIVDIIYFAIKKNHIKLPNWVYIGILIIVLLYGILRNVPYFSYLIPTQVN